jgi:hypothetical protein
MAYKVFLHILSVAAPNLAHRFSPSYDALFADLYCGDDVLINNVLGLLNQIKH